MSKAIKDVIHAVFWFVCLVSFILLYFTLIAHPAALSHGEKLPEQLHKVIQVYHIGDPMPMRSPLQGLGTPRTGLNKELV